MRILFVAADKVGRAGAPTPSVGRPAFFHMSAHMEWASRSVEWASRPAMPAFLRAFFMPGSGL